MEISIILIIIGVVITIIGYFLKEKNERIIVDLDKIKECVEKNAIRICLVENNHIHLSDKFLQLYDAVKDLTREIQKLNVSMGRQNDI